MDKIYPGLCSGILQRLEVRLNDVPVSVHRLSAGVHSEVIFVAAVLYMESIVAVL